MDKKLLLAMQYQCNFAGLGVPWNEIGVIMGPGISGGAVIQHLAKLRVRMIAQGLSVPPPLRRGGGASRISTTASTGPKAKANPTKNGKAKAAPASANSASAKPKKANKRRAAGSYESEEEDDLWENDDSDVEYGEPSAKRAKSDAKGPMRRKVKTEDSEEEVATPRAPKRKHRSSKSSSHDLSAYGTTDINGKPIDYDSDDDTEPGVVAAGAPFLDFDDDYVSQPKTGKKTPYMKKSLIVSLPTSARETRADNHIKNEAVDRNEDEYEDEILSDRVESCVDDSRVLSDEETELDFPTSPYTSNIEDLSAAQPESASGPSNHNGFYDSLYHAGPQANGGLYQNHQIFEDSFADHYDDPSGFQATDGMFENDGLDHIQHGGNFDMGQTSTNFNGDFGDFNGGFHVDFNNNSGLGTGSLSGAGTSSGIAQGNGTSYQSNGYRAFNGINTNVGGLPFGNSNHRGQIVPPPIETSFPNNPSSASTSNTSLNQTPADVGGGYFFRANLDLASFNDSDINFSANDGSDGLFDASNVDGNFMSGGLYGSNAYGN